MTLRRSSRVAAVTSAGASSCSAPTAKPKTPPFARSPSSLTSAPAIPDDNPRPVKRARVDTAKSATKGPSRRTTKAASKSEPSPENFASRVENGWKIGPHVSSAGGVENAVVNAASVGANAFALFLKSQRKWESPPLKDESIEKFKARMKAFGYSPSHVLPHGSYLVNLANPDEEKREKSFKCFLDDLKRCEQLGLSLYNFHPGSTVGAATKEESLTRIAECINRAHDETKYVIIVLENMAGAGNVVGSRFVELGNIIQQVRDKTRVGVCLDTCHMYAAGYDITTVEGWEATMTEFERDVGLSYLRGMHLNDSKGALASKKDRHENIGMGHLGLSTFARILSNPRIRDIPLVLETPAYDVTSSGSSSARDRLATEGMSVWRTEVSVLNRVSGRYATSASTQDGEGRPVDGLDDEELNTCRTQIADAVEKASKLKDGKGRKTTSASRGKKGKRKADEDEDEDVDSCDEVS